MVSMVGDTSRLVEEWQLWNLLPQPLCHRGVRLVPQGDEVPPRTTHNCAICQKKLAQLC